MPRQTAVSQYRLWHFLALNFINIHEMNSRYAIVPILADVKASYNYNETQLGLLGSVFWFAFVIFCLPFGVLGDRYSRKKLLILGQLMEGLGLLLNATSTDFSLFCLGRIITGAFHGAFVIIAPAVVADMFIDEAERSSKTSIFSITISLGLALIFGIEPKIANQFGVTGPFYLFSLISFINAAILVLLPEYERGQGEKQQMELNAPQKIDSEEETEHLTPKKQVEIQEKSNIFKDLKYLISVKTFVFVCLAYGFLSCLTETGLVWIQEFLRRRFINLDRQIPCKTDLYYPENFGPEAKLATESLVSSDLSSDLEISNEMCHNTTLLINNQNSQIYQNPTPYQVNCDDCTSQKISVIFGLIVVIAGAIGNSIGALLYNKLYSVTKLSGVIVSGIGIFVAGCILYLIFATTLITSEMSIWISIFVIFFGVSVSFSVIMDMNNKVIIPQKRSFSNSIKYCFGKILGSPMPTVAGFLIQSYFDEHKFNVAGETLLDQTKNLQLISSESMMKGLYICPWFAFLASVCWLVASKYWVKDEERKRREVDAANLEQA